MATRCNLKIVEKGKTTWLYRHHDGYPAIAGASILREYRIWHTHHRGRYSFADQMITQQIGEKPWKITDAQHHNIEWMYSIKTPVELENPAVIVSKRTWIGEEPEWQIKALTMEGLKDLVRDDVLAINRATIEWLTPALPEDLRGRADEIIRALNCQTSILLPLP